MIQLLNYYRSEFFPIMFEDAKERASKDHENDYEVGRRAYWRKANFNLKRIKMNEQEFETAQTDNFKQIHLLKKCVGIANAKKVNLKTFKDDPMIKGLVSRLDKELQETVIELLTTIPHEEENFTMMPDINCKVLGEIKLFKPISAVELAELVQDMKDKVDNDPNSRISDLT